jgi:hypothetical protein
MVTHRFGRWEVVDHEANILNGFALETSIALQLCQDDAVELGLLGQMQDEVRRYPFPFPYLFWHHASLCKPVEWSIT